MIKTIKSSLLVAAATLLLGISTSASAALAGSWTASNGTASDLATGVDLQMTTPASRFTYSSSAAAAGTFTFTWHALVSGIEDNTTFGTFDGASDATLFLYTLFLNGDPVQGIGPTEANGTGTITVASGDSFGFFMESTAQSVGDAFLTITDLSFREAQTSNVPEPGSIALLGLGLIGLAAVRRRKTA